MAYSDIQLDALKETMNIGGGKAATTISQMIGSVIRMRVPEVTILSYSELYAQVMADDQEVYAVLSSIEGELKGAMLFVITNAAAKDLSGLMVGTTEELSEEIKVSAVSELTNIVSSSFLTSIGGLLDKKIKPEVPCCSYDVFGAVISSAYMEFDQFGDEVMVIRNEFSYDSKQLEASLYFIPEVGVIDKIIKALGV
ncbi:chemotaxis protein, CheC [Ligilactobacillus salitolerans]|uniref:Chemotaxis protein, CheC n=1 Tax=Ligilactobacillus salitolerans TaxID=1808352 RepID=A0A401ITT3_9LACO|nr:chemotaxis protein CheC [Ligilactobacillus salitolerans]GBG94907.1 chemotaxis protein, CheC [Ligilactobacillus salitolerans]